MNRYRAALLAVLLITVVDGAAGWNSAQAAAEPVLTVHVDHPLGQISPDLRGVNQRYPDCGSYAWNCTTDAPVVAVVNGARATGITFLRFPGGTVSSTYLWTNGIGPVNARPIWISGNGMPTSNEYGFDEHMALCAAIGVRTTVMVNFGLGTAQEAAAWVAYANGDPNDARPIGVDRLGRDWKTVGYWARLRDANQRARGIAPHLYGMHYWEVGNELYGKWEFSWTHDPVVRQVDWRSRVSVSDGTPNQVVFVRYPPVVPGTERIDVAGLEIDTSYNPRTGKYNSN
ncbi:MAG TPA: hypothetical protein ENH11_00570 [Candidatus Acetothermia bacterium]|nr:hypothetical protein [Candidatus Acetothermia bacterium]